MHHMRVGSLMVLMLGARLCAQAAPGGLEVTGMLGTQFRTERGSVLDGATIGLGLVLPARGPTRWGIDMSVIQVLARATVDGVRVSSVESSIEGGVMAMTDILRRGEWRLEGGAGAIASVSVGCGHFLQEPVDTTSGAAGCVNSFARRGETRIGVRARLLSEWMSPRVSFFAALIASANTVASGNHVAPGLMAGIRTPLR